MADTYTVVTKRIKVDGAGEYILHGGVKYRPEIVSKIPDGADVTFRLPAPYTDESRATVTYGPVAPVHGDTANTLGTTITETWKPSGV